MTVDLVVTIHPDCPMTVLTDTANIRQPCPALGDSSH